MTDAAKTFGKQPTCDIFSDFDLDYALAMFQNSAMVEGASAFLQLREPLNPEPFTETRIMASLFFACSYRIAQLNERLAEAEANIEQLEGVVSP